MIKKIDHIVITTAYPDKCLNFYEKLGFKSRDAGGRYELFAGDFKINVHILNHELEPHALNVKTGSADLCFEICEDLLSVKQKLESSDIEIEMGIVERTGVKGKMQSVYIRDPDGNLIELCKYQ